MHASSRVAVLTLFLASSKARALLQRVDCGKGAAECGPCRPQATSPPPPSLRAQPDPDEKRRTGGPVGTGSSCISGPEDTSSRSFDTPAFVTSTLRTEHTQTCFQIWANPWYEGRVMHRLPRIPSPSFLLQYHPSDNPLRSYFLLLWQLELIVR